MRSENIDKMLTKDSEKARLIVEKTVADLWVAAIANKSYDGDINDLMVVAYDESLPNAITSLDDLCREILETSSCPGKAFRTSQSDGFIAKHINK